MAYIVDEHVGAPTRQLERDGATDAASTASNECELAAKLGAAHFSRVALTLRSTLPLRACEIGHPSLAASAASAKAAWSMFGTRPRTSSALETTLKPSPTRSKVTVAVTSRDSGLVPLRPSPADSAIA